MNLINDEGYPICVQCGYCCTVGICPYGEWDEVRNRCIFLTENNLCSKYDEIQSKGRAADFSPAFGAGCPSSLNSVRRDRIERMLADDRIPNGT